MQIKFKIKNICESKKIGIRLLSKLSGVSVGTIQIIFKEAMAGNTSFVNIVKISKALEVPLEELYEEVNTDITDSSQWIVFFC